MILGLDAQESDLPAWVESGERRASKAEPTPVLNAIGTPEALRLGKTYAAPGSNWSVPRWDDPTGGARTRALPDAWLWRKTEQESDGQDAHGTFTEVVRVIRNMSGLLTRKSRLPAGRRERIDLAQNLALEFLNPVSIPAKTPRNLSSGVWESIRCPVGAGDFAGRWHYGRACGYCRRRIRPDLDFQIRRCLRR